MHINLTRRQEILLVFTLATIQFIHILDFVVMMPLGPILMEQLSIDAAQFGLLVSSYNFTAGICGLIFGCVIDRFDRRQLLLIVLFAFIIGTALCSLSKTFFQLLFFRVFTGISGGLFNALVYSMVTDIVPFERRGRAMGIVMSAFSVSSIIGVPLGLACADQFGWEASFIFVAILAFLIWIASFFILPTKSNPRQKGKFRELIRRYGQLMIIPRYALSYLLSFTLTFSMFILIPYLAPFAVKNMGIEIYQIKYMYLAGGLCTVITARIFGVLTDRWGARPLFFSLCLLSAIPVLLYTHSDEVSFWYYIFLGCLFMSIVSGRGIPFMTMISAIPEDMDRGAFMSVFNAVRSFGSATAAFAGGIWLVQAPNEGLFLNFGDLGIGAVLMTFCILIVVVFSSLGKAEK